MTHRVDEGVVVAMDTGVDHAPQPDLHVSAEDPEPTVAGSAEETRRDRRTGRHRGPAGSGARGGGTSADDPAVGSTDSSSTDSSTDSSYPDGVPTTILDLRTAFAKAGDVHSPPLGIVQIEREHPMRAAIAFLAVLLFIGLTATAVVLGAAEGVRAAYERVSGPPHCSDAQVADGAALHGWMQTTVRTAFGPKAKVRRIGCVTPDVLDPQTGQAVATTTQVGPRTTKLVDTLRKRGCTLGRPSASDVRTCSVYVGDRLAAVELRPDSKKRTNAFTVTFQ